MPKVQAYIRETNNVLTEFEAAIQKIGQGAAKRAFARAMNFVGSKANTQVRRQVAKQSGIKYGDVSKQVRLRRANVSKLEATIVGRGKTFPLKYFNARQFSYGVRANPWGRSQKFESAFIVKAYDGNVFVRTSAERFPIRSLSGPAVPTEMMRTDVLDLFARSTEELQQRALHEVRLIIEGVTSGTGGRRRD